MERRTRLDLEAQAMRAEVRARLFGGEQPATIGRFEVLGRIGQGGMGVVWLARDPQLERRVALKIVRPWSPGGAIADARDRLLREARALAKLSDPHVVAVYEVGTAGDDVFLAMELVQGPSLRAWAVAAPREWAAIVRCCVQAAHGLAAVHAQGVVHRDVKPDNLVLAGERVRVVDFGLAGEASDGASGTLGTPAYMAPEQRTSAAVGAACDQYALCMTCAELVLGVRPPVDDAAAFVRTARRISGSLRRVLVRGLAERPDDRYRSMAELADALAHTVRSRWLGLAIAAPAVLGLATAAWVVLAADPRPSSCRDAAERAHAVWSEPRRAALAEAFVRAPWGGQADASITAAIDARQESWKAAMEASCTATWIDRTQDERVELWRRLCLEQQLLELDALLESIDHDDAARIAAIAVALRELEPPERCSAEAAAGSRLAWPIAPEELARVRELRGRLAGATALRRAGRFEAGIVVADEIVAAARDQGAIVLEAEALLERGENELAAGKAQVAHDTLVEAIARGEAAHHDDAIARGWISLIGAVGLELGRTDDAEAMLPLADGVLQRLGDPPVYRARLLRVRGALAEQRGDFVQAIALQREALALAEQALGPDHPEVGRVLHMLARAIRSSGDAEGSLPYARRGLALVERTLGPDHPDAGSHHTALAAAAMQLGDYDTGERESVRTLEVLERALGPEHPRVAAALHNLANVEISQRDFAGARVQLERALAIDRATAGPDNPTPIASMYALAIADRHLARYDEADALLADAEALLGRTWGAAHPDAAYLAVARGEVAAARGDHRRAIEDFTRARTILAAALGPEHPRIVHGMIGAALAHLELGEAQTAQELLEAALAIGEQANSDPLELAEGRFALARALHARDREPLRARTLAERARDDYATGLPATAEPLAAVERWLAELPVRAEG